MTDSLPEGTASRQQGTGGGQPSLKPKKKSLYQRYVDAKTGRNIQISDADLLKYTGMARAELKEWAKDRPGVVGNQSAGKLAMGPATGFGGYETSQGYGGWGPNAEGKQKFPPKPRREEKKDLGEEDDD
jgi:hypothetical protein